jgi:surface antigen
MSFVEDRQNSATNGQQRVTGALHMSSQVSQASPVDHVDQMSFPDTPHRPSGSAQQTGYLPAPVTTHALFDPLTPPAVTRHLPEFETGVLTSAKSGTTTSLRQPVVIRSTGRKSSGTMRPPQGRRWVIQLAVTVLIMLIAAATLLTVLPAGTHGEMAFNPFQSVINVSRSGNSDPSLLAQQAATVTAVTRDGFQPTNPVSYTGMPTPPPGMAAPGSGSGDGFTFGNCTYWADLHYHQLTGFWVPWGGNAFAWASGAASSGWHVSSQPHVPSIIVLQPYVEGAGGFGHVAVVVGINSNGTVHTSTMNWYAGGGGFDIVSYWDFSPGPGVSFVWR